jgi:hypothetical protein
MFCVTKVSISESDDVGFAQSLPRGFQVEFLDEFFSRFLEALLKLSDLIPEK